MPMTCARCGAQNPDGNFYCQNCGTALSGPPAGVATAAGPGAVASPPPGPPPSFSSPAYAPTGAGAYQSPYYAPPGGPTPVHRTPWTMIIAGVVALTLIMAGTGTALAVIGSRSNSSSTSNDTASTTAAGIGAGLASPAPGVTPSPVAQPTNGAPGTVSNDGLTMPVPSGWTVQQQDSEAIVLYDPAITGSVSAASGPSNPTQTAQDNMNTIDQYFKSQSPDARHCAGTQTISSTFNGAKGLYWNLCFTITSGGQSVPAAAQVFAGANSSGNVYYLVMVVTRDGNLTNYLNTAKPVLQGIHWKLT